MPAQPERFRFLSAAWLATAVLLAPGCSVLQVGDVVPDYADASTHRGVEVLAFDAESRTLASGGWDGKIGVWTLGSEKPKKVWLAHDGSVQGLSYSGGQLISGGQDGRLVIWSSRFDVRRSVDTGSSITHVQTLNDLVITGHYDGSVRAWTLPALDNVMRLDLHSNDLVAALTVDTQSGRIASSGYGGRVFLIEPAGRYRELTRPPMDAVSLSFVPGGEVLYGGGWVRLYRWSLETDGFDTITTPHWGAIAGLQYLPGEDVLASISRINDSSVFFLDPVTGESVRHFQRQSICGSAIRVSPDERYMAATGDDGIVRIWDLSAATEQ
jgi:WD40 repeat protein